MQTSKQNQGAAKRKALSKTAPAVTPLALTADLRNSPAASSPTDEQIFYLRVLARYLCSRKGIKTWALADAAGIKGDQKQKENKTQAFLNRFTRGTQTVPDYQAFWHGILDLHTQSKRRGIELFDDPIMHQAAAIVFPHLKPNDTNDDTFIDGPLQQWFSVDAQRGKDVRRHYCGLWWIIRPSTGHPVTGTDFNLALLNIPPEGILNGALPLFRFHQSASMMSGGGGVSSQGRLLALHSDQILLIGKRRGSQTPTQLSWKYVWDPDRRRRETAIQGTIFTVNTSGVLIQSYFHGCYIEGSEHLRGNDFDEADGFLRDRLGTYSESDLPGVPTSVGEIHLLRELKNDTDSPPPGLSAINGQQPPHKTIIPVSGLERLKTAPSHGPILTIA